MISPFRARDCSPKSQVPAGLPWKPHRERCGRRIMTKRWITGRELIERWHTQVFELIHCFYRGLQPYDGAGDPIRVGKSRSSYLWGGSGEFLDSDVAHLLDMYLVRAKMRSRGLGVDKEMTKTVEMIKGWLFKLEDVLEYEELIPDEALEEFAREYGIRPSQENQERRLRPSQRHKAACRKVAASLWGKDPSITIAAMIQKDEIRDACEGKVYKEKTIRRWIKDLCPNRKPGRRPADP